MTEEMLIRELDSTTKQLKIWWANKIPKDSYPKKLANKINFLKAYLRAMRLLKDDQHVKKAINDVLGRNPLGGRYISHL